MEKVENTRECPKCKYGCLTEEKKIQCDLKNKEMFYGKRIVCEEVKWRDIN